MSHASWPDEATKTVRVLQIIVPALVAGTMFFLIIALATGGLRAKPLGPLSSTPITLVAVAFAALELVAREIVVRFIVAGVRRKIVAGIDRAAAAPPAADRIDNPADDADGLVRAFAAKTIASAAIFEGVAFLAIIAYLVEGTAVALGLAVFLIVAVASHFPTQSGALDWVERQWDAARQEKALG
jgi:hypothetical protein